MVGAPIPYRLRPCNTDIVTVVVPVYNEEGNITPLVRAIVKAMEDAGREFEIMLVNDGSSDGTAVEIGALAQTEPRLRALHLRSNYGQTTALVAGFHHAQGNVVVTLDGDLQNDPADIPLLLAKMDEGFDVVSGWRSDRKDDAIKRNLPSLLANRLISRATGVKLHDFGCALKAYRREVIRHMHLYGEMHRFIAIYAVLSGGRLGEVPVRHRARQLGKSKYGLERSFKVLFDLLVVLFLQRYAQKPMYLFGGFGVLSLGCSLLAALGAVYYKFLGGKSFIETPLPLISGTFMLVGTLCFLMGLLAELSIRTYHESQDKPTYLIARGDNIDPRYDAV
ncbi:MAG: glycosyltransferase family 2 protein [Opitutaceae bacterium]|nr:glycosyltransferase family 2 protein [Opitutaceae bacterium]